ncbi:3-deoxy-manno-octulosonate cytidylyltransferase [Flavicella marina]|uniref:3-deoxy-manno-octulosonate cytidylyltransferase n=1 Tax=Flavicella marina TaxID=1475951 RepID=UPI00126418CC|nr:3-deoxy-manno-octulosonate cytidylyltransferase [Flavicella marina]
MKKILGIIPARYESTRFPGKPLARIFGKPMIIHVAEKVESALGKENTIIATDDQLIADVVEKHGYKVIITSDKHKTGTDRICEVAQKIKADIYINIQGDEPVINPNDIIKIADYKERFPNHVTNGYTELIDLEEATSDTVPKVVFAENNDLIYMSRLPIPGIKQANQRAKYYKQVCIYAFNVDELNAYGERQEKTRIESFEDIEIIRFLEMGYKVKMVAMESVSLAVDTPKDVIKVENFLKKNSSSKSNES